MRIICEHLGEIELTHPLTPYGADLILAPEDAERLYDVLTSKEVLDNVRPYQFDNILSSRGVKSATIVGIDCDSPEDRYWWLHIGLDIVEEVWDEEDEEDDGEVDGLLFWCPVVEDFVCFPVLDGLSVVRFDYPDCSVVIVDGLECVVTGSDERNIYLKTPLPLREGSDECAQARLTADEDGYLITYYFDRGDGVPRPEEYRLDGKIMQSVVIADER